MRHRFSALAAVEQAQIVRSDQARIHRVLDEPHTTIDRAGAPVAGETSDAGPGQPLAEPVQLSIGLATDQPSRRATAAVVGMRSRPVPGWRNNGSAIATSN